MTIKPLTTKVLQSATSVPAQNLHLSIAIHISFWLSFLLKHKHKELAMLDDSPLHHWIPSALFYISPLLLLLGLLGFVVCVALWSTRR